MFLSLPGSCQVQEETMYVDPKVNHHVLGFLVDGYKRGVVLDPILHDRLQAIIVADYMEYPLLGLYIPGEEVEKGVVYLNQYILIDSLIARTITYHELAHAVVDAETGHYCEHCNVIMSRITPATFGHYYDPAVWTQSVDELFEWIKQNIKTKTEKE